jgi:hypothetical protein
MKIKTGDSLILIPTTTISTNCFTQNWLTKMSKIGQDVKVRVRKEMERLRVVSVTLSRILVLTCTAKIDS